MLAFFNVTVAPSAMLIVTLFASVPVIEKPSATVVSAVTVERSSVVPGAGAPTPGLRRHVHRRVRP